MRTLGPSVGAIMVVVLVVAGPARGQEMPNATGEAWLGPFFNEVRIGGSFSVQPNDNSGFIARTEVLSRQLGQPRDGGLADALLRPRLHVGANIATASGGVSQAFAGLTWDSPSIGPVFFEATFGGTLHDGPLVPSASGLDLGCPLLFRESVGVGLALGEHWRAVAAVDHSSHAGLCKGANSGITHAGAYLGYHF